MICPYHDQVRHAGSPRFLGSRYSPSGTTAAESTATVEAGVCVAPTEEAGVYAAEAEAGVVAQITIEAPSCAAKGAEFGSYKGILV